MAADVVSHPRLHPVIILHGILSLMFTKQPGDNPQKFLSPSPLRVYGERSHALAQLDATGYQWLICCYV